MRIHAFTWFFLNLLSVAVLAFYSMLEMAAVSFNKVRLQYYVSKGYKRAIWLNYLLQHPSRLFGTTLIGVNIALVIGSECAREFYSAIGLSPDLAPLTQVLIVVIFGELAPMFAARHYAEHVAMLGIPLIYASAKLMTPLLWVVGLISKGCNYVLSGKETESNIYLSLEELQKILEEHTDEAGSVSESDEFSAIAANIFSLRTKDLKQVMEPIKLVPSLAAAATVQEAARFLKEKGVEFIPLYNRDITNIIGIATARDLIRASDTHKVRDYCSPPWFVPETASLMQILKQFRTNNESLAIILNHHGQAIGLITLDDVLAEIMGKLSYPSNHGASHPIAPKKTQVMLIEKTIPGEMLVGEFNKQFGVEIDKDESLTLSELIERTHGHHPEKGESIYIAPFEFTVKETSLVDIKSVSVNSKN